jgi:tRNA-specific 2-thiouridylase
VRDVSWCGPAPAGPLPCRTRIRSRGAEAEALVTPLDGRRARVEFAEPLRAIAPGQAAVFYVGDEVAGGGWIEAGGAGG